MVAIRSLIESSRTLSMVLGLGVLGLVEVTFGRIETAGPNPSEAAFNNELPALFPPLTDRPPPPPPLPPPLPPPPLIPMTPPCPPPLLLLPPGIPIDNLKANYRPKPPGGPGGPGGDIPTGIAPGPGRNGGAIFGLGCCRGGGFVHGAGGYGLPSTTMFRISSSYRDEWERRSTLRVEFLEMLLLPKGLSDFRRVYLDVAAEPIDSSFLRCEYENLPYMSMSMDLWIVVVSPLTRRDIARHITNHVKKICEDAELRYHLHEIILEPTELHLHSGEEIFDACSFYYELAFESNNVTIDWEHLHTNKNNFRIDEKFFRDPFGTKPHKRLDVIGYTKGFKPNSYHGIRHLSKTSVTLMLKTFALRSRRIATHRLEIER
uniref:Uncharacterized protein n=1 Tax=Glossina palpalis gambiensis TaxID=67801 RepID=A0A1B0AZT0_9MUSC